MSDLTAATDVAASSLYAAFGSKARRFERATGRYSDGPAAYVRPGDASPKHLAPYVRLVLHGMAVQAVDGATREELDRVVDLALQAWPAAARGAAS